MENKIKEIREKKNMTQREVSSISGVNLRTLQRYEAGETDSVRNFIVLAQSMGVGLEELFEGAKVDLMLKEKNNMNEDNKQIEELIKQLIEDEIIGDVKIEGDNVSMKVSEEKMLEMYLMTPVLCIPSKIIDSIEGFEKLTWESKLLMIVLFLEASYKNEDIELNENKEFTVEIETEKIEAYFDTCRYLDFDNPFLTGSDYIFKMDVDDKLKSSVDFVFEQKKYVMFATVANVPEMFQFEKFRKYFDGVNLGEDGITLGGIAKKENVSEIYLGDLLWMWIKYGFLRYCSIDKTC